MRPQVPDKDAIALLPLFDRLGLDRITLVRTGEQALRAQAELLRASAWGFDTESKPTFKAGETSDGPHVLQLATAERAWVFRQIELMQFGLQQFLVRQLGLVLSDEGWGQASAQRVLHHFVVFAGAQQQADGGVFVGLFVVAV